MKKIFTKLIGVTLGLAMAVGVGVGVAANNKAATGLNAAGGTYEKITSIGSLTSGDKYLIVSETDSRAFDGSLATIDATSNYISVSISASKITVASDYYFTITSKTGGYSIQGCGGKFIGSDVANGNEMDSSNTDTVNVNTITWDSTESCFVIRGANSYLVYNNTSGQTRFRYYKPTTCGNGLGKDSYHKISLFKEVQNRTLSSIALSGTYPTEFYQGDEFSHEGMVVTATYTNSTTSNVTASATFSGYDMSTISNSQTVTVSYTESAITKTATYTIAVKAPKTITGITESGDMINKTYYEGEEWDLSGLYLSVAWSEGDPTIVNVTDLSESSYALSDNNPVAGNTTLDIIGTYQGFDFEFNVTGITVNAPAASVTFAAGTDLGETSANNSPDIMKKGGYTVSSTDAAFATAQYRIYQNSSITFSISSGNIGKITIVQCDDSRPVSNLSLSGENGTWNGSTGIWVGSASSVTFTATAQARASSFIIEKYSPAPSLGVDKAEIDLFTFDRDGKQVVATALNVDSPVFVWTPASDDVTIEVLDTVDNSETVAIKPSKNHAADTLVEVAVQGTELSELIEVHVKETISVSEAVAAIDAAPGNNVQETVYVKGIISQVDSYSSQYHSITYWISEDGTTTDQFEVYSGKDLGGADFASVTDVKVGAIVIVKGNIKKFNDIYEFNLNNELAFYSSAFLNVTEAAGEIDSVSIAFDTKISKSVWNSFANNTEYGMMMFKTDKATPSTVEAKYTANPSKVLIVNGDYGLDLDDEGDYYLMTVNVNNVQSTEYARKFCVAPYLVSGSEHYFFCEMVWTVNSLATKGLVNSGLSETTLNTLKGVNS